MPDILHIEKSQTNTINTLNEADVLQMHIIIKYVIQYNIDSVPHQKILQENQHQKCQKQE